MVADLVVRDSRSPIYYACIVSVCKDPRSWILGWEEGLGPRFGGIVGGPRSFSVAAETMDKDDAEWKLVSRLLVGKRRTWVKMGLNGSILDAGDLWAVEYLETSGGGPVSRRSGFRLSPR